MRVDEEKIKFIKKQINKYLNKADIYLFGSRVDDLKKGGDIDILVIYKRKLKLAEKRKIKIEFYKKFGEQKIDIVSFTNKEDDAFKNIALEKAIKI